MGIWNADIIINGTIFINKAVYYQIINNIIIVLLLLLDVSISRIIIQV